jgi:hypothetical protein
MLKVEWRIQYTDWIEGEASCDGRGEKRKLHQVAMHSVKQSAGPV